VVGCRSHFCCDVCGRSERTARGVQREEGKILCSLASQNLAHIIVSIGIHIFAIIEAGFRYFGTRIE